MTIYNTALSTIGFREYSQGYKPCWNMDINNLKNITKKLNRKLNKIKYKYPSQYKNFPHYNQLLLEYKAYHQQKTQCIRIAKKLHNQYVNSVLQQSKFNDKLSWHLIKSNKHKPHNDIHPLKLDDNLP